jgi:hypothetical protein
MLKLKHWIREYPIFSWLFLFILCPLLLTPFLFQGHVWPIIIRLNLPPAQPIKENSLEVIQPVSIQKRIIDFWLQKSMQATEYFVCIKNNNEVEINQIKIQLPYEKDPEVGAMDFKFNEKDTNSVYAKIGDFLKCKMLPIDRTLETASTTVTYRLPKEIPIMMLN